MENNNLSEEMIKEYHYSKPRVFMTILVVIGYVLGMAIAGTYLFVLIINSVKR